MVVMLVHNTQGRPRKGQFFFPREESYEQHLFCTPHFRSSGRLDQAGSIGEASESTLVMAQLVTSYRLPSETEAM